MKTPVSKKPKKTAAKPTAARQGKSKLSAKDARKTFGEFVHSVHPKKPAKPKRIITIAGQPTRFAREIKIGDRHRKDMGDIAGLAKSIDERGALLQPIVIDKDNNLIAGQRRLAAWALCKFRRDPIPVIVVDIDAIVAGEWDENAKRKDFTPSECASIARALEPIAAAKAKERQLAGKKVDAGEGRAPCAADLVAAYVGKDRKTIQRAQEVIDAADRDPERYGSLRDQMDKSGKVNGAWRRLQVHNQVADIKARKENGTLAVPEGKFDRIVADMPWPYEADDETPAERGRAVRGYATMSIKEMKALPIADRCADSAVLYFWVTNFHMEYAYQVMRAWGFAQFPTIITWTKDKFGKGQRLRCATEHCIIAIKGKPVWNLTNQTTRLDGPVREDSRKPDEFYALIDAITPAERSLELFARRELPAGWVGFGDQVGTLKDKPTKAPENLTENIIDEAPVEFAELQALETIEAGRDIDIKMPIVAALKEQKFARGSVKLKLTKAGMNRVEALRKEAYGKADEAEKALSDFDRLIAAGDKVGHLIKFSEGDPDQHGKPMVCADCLCRWASVALDTPGGRASQRTSIIDHLRPVTALALRAEAAEKTAKRGSRRAKRLPMEALEVTIVGIDSGTEHVDQGQEDNLSQVDCRVCAAGAGLCAECIAAADHIITTGLDLAAEPAQFIASCSCGFSCQADDLEGGYDADSEAYPTPPVIADAVKAHWQNVVTEAKAASASEPAPDPMDIPPRLRRAQAAE